MVRKWTLGLMPRSDAAGLFANAFPSYSTSPATVLAYAAVIQCWPTPTQAVPLWYSKRPNVVLYPKSDPATGDAFRPDVVHVSGLCRPCKRHLAVVPSYTNTNVSLVFIVTFAKPPPRTIRLAAAEL